MTFPYKKNYVPTVIGILDLDNIVSVTYFAQTDTTVVQGVGENNYFTSMGITLCNQLVEALRNYGETNKTNQDSDSTDKEGQHPKETRI